MSKTTDVSIRELAKKLFDTATKTPSSILSCNGSDLAALEKALKFSFKGLFSEEHKRFRTITLLNVFGIILKQDGTLSLMYKNSDALKKWFNHVKPFMSFVGSAVLDRIKIDIMSSVEKSELGKKLRSMVSDNTLIEALMEKVRPAVIKAHQKKQDVSTVSEDKANIISALKIENQNLKKQVEKANTSSGADALLFERISESIDTILPELKFVREKWNGGSTFNKNEHATAVLHISDWHIGSKENVDGLNDFNYSIACDRVKTLTNKYIDWTKMHRSMYNIDELVIIATGDMISGDIHEELLRTNEFSVPEQCVKASMLISKMANELSSHFKKVRIEYIVADNHSRTTKKIQFGDGKNSYNYIVGTMSKLMLKNNDAVEFNIYPEIQKVIKVENLRYLITHGNCVRGGFAGIPFYSMQRKVGAEAAVRMNMPESTHFDKIVMGHYHTPLRSVAYEMTGCLSSTTAFDQAAGRHCKACQTGWVVSRDNELDYYELWLS